MFFDRGELEQTLDGKLDRRVQEISLDASALGTLACPKHAADDVSPLTRREAQGALLLECGECGGTWLDGGLLPQLRRSMVAAAPETEGEGEVAQKTTRTVRPLLPLQKTTRTVRPLVGREDGPGVGERLYFEHPWVEVLAPPLAFVVGFVMSSTGFGQLLIVPAEIMFHEIGHALPAWLSGRAALPLPCGLTFWKEEPSLITGACFAFLCGVLVYRGYEEKRRFAVLLGSSLLVGQVFMSLVLDTAGSKELILAGGLAGEFIVPTVAIIAFHHYMPDRLRWDFWRFLVLFPAAATFMAATKLWLGVAAGTTLMPVGSIMGSDGGGDLERLMHDYAWHRELITGTYLTVAGLCVVVLALNFGVVVLQAARQDFKAKTAPEVRASPSRPA